MSGTEESRRLNTFLHAKHLGIPNQVSTLCVRVSPGFDCILAVGAASGLSESKEFLNDLKNSLTLIVLRACSFIDTHRSINTRFSRLLYCTLVAKVFLTLCGRSYSNGKNLFPMFEGLYHYHISNNHICNTKPHPACS
jgi:hypothetical protein